MWTFSKLKKRVSDLRLQGILDPTRGPIFAQGI